MSTEDIPSSHQPPSDRRPAVPPLWTGFTLRMQPTAATPYTYQASPCKDSPSELLGEKTRSRVVGQYGLTVVGDRQLSDARLNSKLSRGTVQSGDQSIMDDQLLLHPNSLIPKYSSTTKYRWACFLLHIILCIIVLGIAVAIYQGATQGIWVAYSDGTQTQKRWRGQSLESNPNGIPPPEYARLSLWRVVPFISVIPSGLAIALLWILDVYYPLTWVSKPKGQVLYVLSIMLFQCGFAVAWCYITPIACWWIGNGTYHQNYRRVFRFSWTVAACLLTQIVILTIVVLLIILTISQHIQAGRKEALEHPLCRYNPAAARSLRLLPRNQSTVMRSQNATTNTLSVPSNAHPPQCGVSLLTSSVESPAGSDVQSTQHHQNPVARTGTAPSTVSESEGAR